MPAPAENTARRFGYGVKASSSGMKVKTKLTAAGWFDYFHLFKVEGRWKIANIIFEPLPD